MLNANANDAQPASPSDLFFSNPLLTFRIGHCPVQNLIGELESAPCHSR